MADDVSVKFGASIEGAVKGINEIKEHLEEMKENGVSGLIEGFKGIAEAVGVAFAIEKLHEFGEQVAELGEKIERLSTLTGLSTDQIQEFQFAVKMTGGDADTAAASLLRFEAHLASAQAGSGPAAEAYKQMGISLTDAQGKFKQAGEILDEIADKFAASADGATKVQYATELGSRGFANMIPVLNKGREGLAELRKELEATNSKMSPEQVHASAQAAEKMKLLSQAYLGFKEGLTDQSSLNNFYTGLTHIVEGMTKLLAKWKEWADKPIILPFMPPLADSGTFPSGATWSRDKPASVNEATFLDKSGNPIQKKPSLPPLKTGGGKEKADDSLDLAEIATQQKLAQEELKQKQEALKQQTIAHEQSKVEQIQQEKQAEEAMYQIDVQALQEKAALYSKDSDDYAKTQLQIEVAAAQHQTKMAQYTTKIAQANQNAAQQSYRSWIQALSPIEGAFDGMLSGILSGTQTISQALSSAFANAAISVVESILKIVAEWLIFELVTEGQGTWSDFVAIQGGGGGGGGGFLGSIGSILGFETGTPSVPSTGLYQLHQGEIVVPPGLSAQIRAGSAGLGGSGGGDGVHVTFQIQAIDTQSGAAFIHNNAGPIAKVVAGQIRNANSSLNKTMRTS